MDFNSLISTYSNGRYTFDTLRADTASGLVETSYLSDLIRLMVSEVVENKRINNKFAQFKKKRGYSGKIVNRVHINPVTGKEFTVDGLSTLFDMAPSDVKSAIRKHVESLSYDVTYNKDELRKAFQSEQSLVDFLNLIIASLYNGSEIDDKNNFITLFKDMYENNTCIMNVVATVNNMGVKAFAIKLKSLIEHFKEESTKFNAWKKLNPSDTSAVFWSNPSDICILMPISVAATLDVELYASLFNEERANLDGRIFTVADDKLPAEVQAILFDSTLISIDEIYAELEPTFYDQTKRRYKEIYNTSNEYGINPFANCVILTTAIPEIAATLVRSKSVTVAGDVEVLIPLEISPIGANTEITATASDTTNIPTATVTYSQTTGYVLKVKAVDAGTITFKVGSTSIPGTITINVA